MELFSEIAEDKDNFAKFYEAFGKKIKLGIHEDSQNRSKLAEYLRFYSTKSSDEQTSLKDYITRMPEVQKSIYYLTGESLSAVKDSPFFEVLKKEGFEVLLIDPVDEYAITQLKEFDGKKLVRVSEALEWRKPKRRRRLVKMRLLNWMTSVRPSRMPSVTIVSNRIADSPCVLVTGQYGWSPNTVSVLRAVLFTVTHLFDRSVS